MYYIKNINRGIFNTKIETIDKEKNKKKDIKFSNILIKMEELKRRDEMYIAKAYNILKLYSNVANETDYNEMKKYVEYGMISSRDLIVLQRAFYEKKINQDTVKEFLERISGMQKDQKQNEKEKSSIEKLKVDPNSKKSCKENSNFESNNDKKINSKNKLDSER